MLPPKWTAALLQPELTAAAAEGKGTDPFAEERRAHPDDRLILFQDRRNAVSFVMRVPPTSPWYPLLPPQQIADIVPAGDGHRE